MSAAGKCLAQTGGHACQYDSLVMLAMTREKDKKNNISVSVFMVLYCVCVCVCVCVLVQLTVLDPFTLGIYTDLSLVCLQTVNG